MPMLIEDDLEKLKKKFANKMGTVARRERGEGPEPSMISIDDNEAGAKSVGEATFTNDEFFEGVSCDIEEISDPNFAYIHDSYLHFLDYFRNIKSRITEHNLVIAAHFTYGWMPTILTMRGELDGVLDIVNSVKEGTDIGNDELDAVARAINNSHVGASKLLHFINPKKHAIWDSRVGWYLLKKEPNYYNQLNNPEYYFEYLDILGYISKDIRFPGFKSKIEQAVGYPISDNRAAEMVMFHRGGKTRDAMRASEKVQKEH